MLRGMPRMIVPILSRAAMSAMRPSGSRDFLDVDGFERMREHSEFVGNGEADACVAEVDAECAGHWSSGGTAATRLFDFLGFVRGWQMRRASAVWTTMRSLTPIRAMCSLLRRRRRCCRWRRGSSSRCWRRSVASVREIFRDGSPAPDVVPIERRLDHEDARGFFHDGVVDRRFWARREKRSRGTPGGSGLPGLVR